MTVETAPFGTVLKFKDYNRGPELSRYMLIGPAAPWDEKPRVNVVCLFVGHTGDDWTVDGDAVSCLASDMEIVSE